MKMKVKAYIHEEHLYALYDSHRPIFRVQSYSIMFEKMIRMLGLY